MLNFKWLEPIVIGPDTKIKKLYQRYERLAKLENALLRFGKQYNIPADVLQELRGKLVNVPANVERREKRLFAGLAPEPSSVSVPNFGRNLRAAMRESGFAKKLSANEQDTLRKRLNRRNSTIDFREGAPGFDYIALEREYATEIARLLDGAFPISRAAEPQHGNNGTPPRGPAFDLLTAALEHALPETGVGNAEARVKRIRRKFPPKRKD